MGLRDTIASKLQQQAEYDGPPDDMTLEIALRLEDVQNALTSLLSSVEVTKGDLNMFFTFQKLVNSIKAFDLIRTGEERDDIDHRVSVYNYLRNHTELFNEIYFISDVEGRIDMISDFLVGARKDYDGPADNSVRMDDVKIYILHDDDVPPIGEGLGV